jgi:simple sugar transport system substrate-binding protein
MLSRRLVNTTAVFYLIYGISSSIALAEGDDLSVYFVGCAPPQGFHGYLARGADDAGDDLGVGVTYIYPERLTIPNQVQKFEEAMAAQPDGIILCNFAEDSAYKDVIDRAEEMGIAVGSAAAPATGSTVRPQDDPFLFRVGSDEYEAGKLTAEKLIQMGVSGRVLLGNQDLGDASCRERAQGQIDTLAQAGIESELLELTYDPGQQAEAIFNYLRRHPETAAATSVCDVIDGFLAAKEQSGRDTLVLTGYDIVAQSLEAIRDGRQAFTIDQQQYWRGYMPVLLLTHHVRYGLTQANYFMTGPTLVDLKNVDEVSALVEQGIR